MTKVVVTSDIKAIRSSNPRSILIMRLTLTLLLCGFSSFVFASSCHQISVEEKVAQADVIFTGHALNATGSEDEFSGKTPIDFFPINVWKGTLPPKVKVSVSGLGIVPGRDYIVFAKNNNGTLQSRICEGIESLDSRSLTSSTLYYIKYQPEIFEKGLYSLAIEADDYLQTGYYNKAIPPLQKIVEKLPDNEEQKIKLNFAIKRAEYYGQH